MRLPILNQDLEKIKNNYKNILKKDENNPSTNNSLGVLLAREGNFEQALEHFKKALKYKPDYLECYYNLALLLTRVNKLDDAIKCYYKVLKLNPNHIQTYNNLGNLFINIKNYEEAYKHYKKAITLNPNYFQSYYNIANLFQEQRNYYDAEKNYKKAIQLNPDFSDAYNNLGVLYDDMLKIDKALENFDNVLKLKPNNAEAIYNKSLLFLLKGDLNKGFEFYEYRWKKKKFTSIKKDFSKRLWLGKEDLSNKTILIHSEQGFGDTIQFCRYLKFFSKFNTKVIFEVHKYLYPLMKQSLEVEQLVIQGEKLPEFDFHCPLMSLPLAFNTTIDSIPSFKYYLQTDKDKSKYWKDKLKSIKKIKVGIVWSGSSTNKRDTSRSIPLEEFIKYLPKNYEYISLQKEIKNEEKKLIENKFHIHFFGNELDDYSDTAALCDCLDFIISVDTSVAHLAGALGKKTFLLLSYRPDWRWFLNRDDTPWYPSVTLIRSDSYKNNKTALQKLKSLL